MIGNHVPDFAHECLHFVAGTSLGASELRSITQPLAQLVCKRQSLSGVEACRRHLAKVSAVEIRQYALTETLGLLLLALSRTRASVRTATAVVVRADVGHQYS
jgi:hypothetical protein